MKSYSYIPWSHYVDIHGQVIVPVSTKVNNENYIKLVQRALKIADEHHVKIHLSYMDKKRMLKTFPPA